MIVRVHSPSWNVLMFPFMDVVFRFQKLFAILHIGTLYFCSTHTSAAPVHCIPAIAFQSRNNNDNDCMFCLFNYYYTQQSILDATFAVGNVHIAHSWFKSPCRPSVSRCHICWQVSDGSDERVHQQRISCCMDSRLGASYKSQRQRRYRWWVYRPTAWRTVA